MSEEKRVVNNKTTSTKGAVSEKTAPYRRAPKRRRTYEKNSDSTTKFKSSSYKSSGRSNGTNGSGSAGMSASGASRGSSASRTSSGSNTSRGSNGSSASRGSGSSRGSNKHISRTQHGHTSQKNAPKLRIIPLGGLDGIGKNMTVFEYGNDMIVVDAGMMFPDDDFPGVDLLLPDYTYILENSHKLRGIIITHGHEDHTGAIPYLLKDLDCKTSIYSTSLTLGFIEGKLDEHNFHDVNLQIIVPGNSIKLGSFGCEFFSVNHSIPAAVGVFIRTPAGTVLHTGDFKLDQTPIDGIKTDFGAMSRFAQEGVDLLMSDSTNANVAAFTRSEAEVGKVLTDIIANAKRRVIVASFASHIHRIQQVCDATVKAHRKVAVTGRSMLTNIKVARELGYLNIRDEDIIDAYQAKDIPCDRLVVLCTGSQGEPLSALTRMANGEHKTIDIEHGDTVIISASPVPGNEKAVNRVINSLSKIGVDVYDKSRAMVHVSGHAGQEELKLVMSICRPKNFMPVHGEAQHLRAHAELAQAVGISKHNVFILENGNTLEMRGGKITYGQSVDSGVVFVEGLSVGDVSTLVLKDRKTLANEGMVTCVIMVGKRDGHTVDDVEIIMRGVGGGDDATLVDDATKVVKQMLAEDRRGARIDPRSLRRNARDTLSKFLWNRCRRRPLIIPIIMEV